MNNLDFLKFMDMLEDKGVDVFDAELSIKHKNGRQEICIKGNPLSVLGAAEELAAKAINSACDKAPLSREDAYMVFCENLKGLLKLQGSKRKE